MVDQESMIGIWWYRWPASGGDHAGLVVGASRWHWDADATLTVSMQKRSLHKRRVMESILLPVCPSSDPEAKCSESR